MVAFVARTVDSQFARAWRHETHMAVLQWGGVMVCLFLPLAFPGIAQSRLLLLGGVLALGSAGVTGLLRRGPCPTRLRLIRRLATAVEWTGSLGFIVLASPVPLSFTPALLLFLVIYTGWRYGLQGVLAATLSASLAAGALVAAQVWLLRVLDPDVARIPLLSLLICIWGLSVVLGVREAEQRQETARLARERREAEERLERRRQDEVARLARELGAAEERLRREIACREERDAELWRLQSGLSPKQWEVLRLLARPDLSPEQIARKLFIALPTLKTHIRALGNKLGVVGRRAIVAEARRRGWLPPVDVPPVTG